MGMRPAVAWQGFFGRRAGWLQSAQLFIGRRMRQCVRWSVLKIADKRCMETVTGDEKGRVDTLGNDRFD